jgi:subfamily B ATP-binding cassette protein MsbA
MLSFFKRFRVLLRPYRLRLAGGATLVLVGAAADVAKPWPVKIAVDGVVHPIGHALPRLPWGLAQGADLLLVAVGMLAVLAAVSALVSHATVRFLDGTGERLGADLRAAVFAHLQALDVGFHERSRTGDVVTRATADVDFVQDMLVTFLGVLVPNLAVVAAIAAVCLSVNLRFGALAVSVAPVMLLAVSWFKRRIKAAARAARGKEGMLASLLTETFQATRVMQAFTAEDQHRDKFDDSNRERLKAGLRTVKLQASLAPTVDVLSAAGTGLVLFFGVHEVLAGRMTLGTMLVFLAYLNTLYDPVRKFAKATAVISRGIASAERLAQLLDEQPAIADLPGATPAPAFAGHIELRRAQFCYPAHEGDEVSVLNAVDLVIEPGQTVALVGSTGCGKTTIASLIPRLLDVQGGEVRIDGRDVRSMTLASLRAQIAIVPQEPTLFAGTIRDNIAYGRPDASSADIDAAAQAAHVDEFASRFPAGLDTPVSESGASLSGGQRQRVAMARALLRNAPIVILDEPTAGLDPVSEALVMDGLKRLSVGRTVLVIAHRLRTLVDVDAIHVLDGGRIVESGTHCQLLAAGGRYASLLAATEGPDEATTRLPQKQEREPAALPMRHSAVAILSRPGPDGPEVLLVHRNREDDWGLPKGCVEEGETIAAALAREVAEETGLVITKHTEIAESVHLDRKGRRRHFHYLLTSTSARRPTVAAPDGDEIDGVAWQSLDEAVLIVDNARERTALLHAAHLLGADGRALVRHHGPRALLLMRSAQAHLHDGQPGAYHAPISLQGHRELASLAAIIHTFDPATVATMPWSRAFDSVRLVAANLQATLSIQEPEQLIDAAAAHHDRGQAPALICTDEATILRILTSLQARGVALDGEPRARHASLWIVGRDRATYLAPITQTLEYRTAYNAMVSAAPGGGLWASPDPEDNRGVAAL